MIERYTIKWYECNEEGIAEHTSDNNGDWCKYEDAKKLILKIKELENEIKELENDRDSLYYNDEMRDSIQGDKK